MIRRAGSITAELSDKHCNGNQGIHGSVGYSFALGELSFFLRGLM